MKQTNPRILIVDDESGVRFALNEALRSWGYECIQAATVKEAESVFAEERPGIALLDIDLPDGSGLDILKGIKELEPETVVVMITGNVNLPNVMTALRGGAHDFIGKPIHLEELRVTLRNATETRELRREVQQSRRERTDAFGFEQILGGCVKEGNRVGA